MSSQVSRVRRTASPPQQNRPQPLRATVPFQLRHGAASPGRPSAAPGPQKLAASPSPTPEHRTRHSRRSPELRGSPERRSPNSPVCKGDRLRSHSRNSPSGVTRRPPPVDPIAGSYLTGQWPRDREPVVCVRDKATQTPSTWSDDVGEREKGTTWRVDAWSSSEQRREIAKMRQQLQRTKQGGKHGTDREPPQSPMHRAPPPSVQQQASLGKPVGIALCGLASISKAVLPRLRGSMEALNQEIEHTLVRDACDGDTPRLGEVPDGHRAPPPNQSRCGTRSVDTQTPSALDVTLVVPTSPPASPAAGPPSTYTPLAAPEGCMSRPGPTNDSPIDNPDKEGVSSSPSLRFAAPKPWFQREPPEGCERIKVFEENPQQKAIPLWCPDKNKLYLPGSTICLDTLIRTVAVKKKKRKKKKKGKTFRLSNGVHNRILYRFWYPLSKNQNKIKMSKPMPRVLCSSL
uniref:Uncharacterized protein n=1 Tax=Eptatretus burgeri TaxID=7764 RepID=A0A8C4NDI0_EPTBU